MANAFDYKQAAALPVGSVLQSPINIETLTGGQWVALDGRDCNRGDYPELSPYFPAGVFTSTARTLSESPGAAAIASDDTTFFTSAAAATNVKVQYSTNGSTWATVATTPWVGGGSASLSSVISAGSRTIMVGGAGTTTPQVIAKGADASVAGNYTATILGTITTLTQGLAYGSTANAGAGRTVLCVNGSLPTATGLFYMDSTGGATTTWNACSGGSTRTRLGVVWTGQKFIVICSDNTGQAYNTIQTSLDGATWVDGVIPQAVSGASFIPSIICSDGNGTVVISLYNGAAHWFVVSKDHGVTWRKVNTPLGMEISVTGGVTKVLTPYLSFVNRKFIATSGNVDIGNSAISSDGLSWQVEPLENGRGAASANGVYAMAYKAGTYVGVATGTTDALSLTEDMSKFRMPISDSGSQASNSANYGDGGRSSHPLYMKARS